jgi:hypothetical protein
MGKEYKGTLNKKQGIARTPWANHSRESPRRIELEGLAPQRSQELKANS